MPEILLPAGGWRPRNYQRNLWGYLERGGKRAVAVWHRRAGKDEQCLHWAAVAAHQKPATYWHMLPQAAQARKAIWDAVNPHTGKKRIDEAFPLEVRSFTRNNEMIIGFKSGSTWQVVGSDNYNSLVGSPPHGVVFSEWSLSDPAAWSYISPILEENGGWAMFIYTPRGRNHGKTLYENALTREGWFAEKLSARDTGVFSERQLKNIELEYQQDFGVNDGRSRFRQEYLVDFEAAVSGSYFGIEMDRADSDGRIGVVPWKPNLPVHTCWDLGFRDSQCIWFFQIDGDEWRWFDYLENSGVPTEWYANQLRSKPYTYGTHLLPHDGKKVEQTSGLSVQDVLSTHGIQATIVDQTPKHEQINAARRLIPISRFDKTKATRGIETLQNFRREWDDKRKIFHDKPLHDWASHGADAFMTGAVAEVRGLINTPTAWTKPLQYASTGVV